MSPTISIFIQNLLSKTFSYRTIPFIIFRVLFGMYLFFYYLTTLPYGSELYSNQGMLPEAGLNWTHGFFPNILNVYDTPLIITILFVVGSIVSLLFTGGILPRAFAVILWYIQTCLYNRNVLTDEPSQAYIGLLLVTFALLPKIESIAYLFRKEHWHTQAKILIPYFVYMVPVFIFGITFTLSAYDKLLSSSWENGNALMLLLTMEIAKPSVLLSFLKSHTSITSILSYLALFSQFICLPLVISGFYRIAIGIQVVAFSFAFLVLDINQVTLGMLLFLSFYLFQDIFIFKK